jgi:hypothetical protein
VTRRRLPLGIQNFRELRELDCYYVDRTAYVKRLLYEGKDCPVRGGPGRACFPN